MKKLMLLVAIIFFTGLNGLIAQHVQINPIPSFNFPLNSGNTLFKENISTPSCTKEKRDMDVVVSSASHGSMAVFATVWIVKGFGSVVLGPFKVDDNEKLTVGIDNESWGVIINTDFDVIASVWTE